jgi:hypothetical protein
VSALVIGSRGLYGLCQPSETVASPVVSKDRKEKMKRMEVSEPPPTCL